MGFWSPLGTCLFLMTHTESVLLHHISVRCQEFLQCGRMLAPEHTFWEEAFPKRPASSQNFKKLQTWRQQQLALRYHGQNKKQRSHWSCVLEIPQKSLICRSFKTLQRQLEMGVPIFQVTDVTVKGPLIYIIDQCWQASHCWELLETLGMIKHSWVEVEL